MNATGAVTICGESSMIKRVQSVGCCRRVTDELHETRPKWLRSISIGAIVILVSIVVEIACVMCSQLVINAIQERWHNSGQWVFRIIPFGVVLGVIIFVIGVFLLTRREGYPPADLGDRWLRRWLRLAALAPLLAVSLAAASFEIEVTFLIRGITGRPFEWLITAAAIASTVGAAPLPLLLFLHLRGLAKRARSAHLAEHCMIVGIGTTATLIYTFGVYELLEHARGLGFNEHWTSQATTSLVMASIAIVVGCLFVLWSFYLLLRFAIALTRAARHASRKWKRDDRAVSHVG